MYRERERDTYVLPSAITPHEPLQPLCNPPAPKSPDE